MRITHFTLLALLVPAVARATDYEIKLVRPVKVGQTYSLTADAAMMRTTKVTIAGEKSTETQEGFGVRLEGMVEVLAVNSDGEEGKVSCKIGKCVRITPTGETAIVPAGRVVTATGSKDDTTFSVDKGTLSPEAAAALDLVLRLGEEDGYTDDKIYGTTKRQNVGGTWSIDTKASSEEAAADGVKFDPKDITGALKLDGVETVDGVECLHITGETEIRKLKTDPPKGMKSEPGTLAARYGGMYPVDPNLGALGETMSVTHTATFRGTNASGREAVLESKVQRAVELKRKYLSR